MRTKTFISFITIISAVALATPAFAQERTGTGQRQAQCTQQGAQRGIHCDGSGPGQGTPRQDGSGKLDKANTNANANGNGTPRRDGSGSGNGGKGQGKGKGGNGGNCPNG